MSDEARIEVEDHRTVLVMDVDGAPALELESGADGMVLVSQVGGPAAVLLADLQAAVTALVKS